MTTYAAPAYDLRSLIESRAPTRLSRHARTDGGEYWGPCPFPDCSSDDNGFHVWPYREHPGYWCRVCGRTGGPIRFLMDYEGKAKWEALRELDLQDENEYHPLPPTYMTQSQAPGKIWQETGRGFIHLAQSYLWSSHGTAGLAYLYGRGFTDATIREAMLGFCPGGEMADTQWGLHTSSGKVKIPKGIVIPWYCGGELWKITLRLGKSSPNRYTQILGSSECLYNADKISSDSTIVLYEGVFDALSGQQVAPEFAHVATDDVQKCRSARWIARLCLASRVLVAYDADEAGDRESLFWTHTLSHATRWRPWAKDVNTMLVQGPDILEWLVLGLT